MRGAGRPEWAAGSRGGGLAGALAAALVPAALASPAAAQIPQREPAALEVPPSPAAAIRRERPTDPRAGALAESYRRFLEEVDVLIADAELEAFFALGADYQRDAFIREFWRSRDPYPETPRNEFAERYRARVEEARRLFPTLADLRARALLYLGGPDERFEVGCGGVLWPIEAWFFARHERVYGELALLFYRKWGASHWRLWDGAGGVEEFYRDDSLGGSTTSCNYEKFRFALALIGKQGFDYLVLVSEVEDPPKPERPEWLPTFAAYSTELPAGAPAFAAEVSWRFPGWHGRRTAVEGLLRVPLAEVEPSSWGGHGAYNFALNGEVLLGEELFERFRYRFDVPAAEAAGGSVPLAFQRYLRPGGPYRVILLLEDLASGRKARSEHALSVPAPEALAAAPAPPDGETARLLAAAEAALARGETSLQIVRPLGDLQTGLVRFDTLLVGEPAAQVAFALDGTPILTKTGPPFSVELDLGPLPAVHTLRATAFGASGDEVASDEILVNEGGHRFAVRLTDPVPGRAYAGAVRARATVEVPEGEALERLELFVNEELRATLYGPPWVHPLALPPGGGPAYVRVVARLAGDGGMAEDLVWVNAPPGLGDALSIDLVEVYASVFDRDRRPVAGLGEADFAVLEDGVRQQILRFEPLADAPFHAAVLLDVSASMQERLDAARHAALGFFRRAVSPRDRLALITFNDRPHLAVRFTSDPGAFGGGLAGLKAERGTALYDSLIWSLFTFNGLGGQRALIVLSDGQDEGSRYGFEPALDYARRSGVTLYTVGIDLSRRDGGAARRMARLAAETGGRAFEIAAVEELPAVYAAIAAELRSRYLLAYQSANTGGGEAFRAVEVRLARRGLNAQAMRGYYPRGR